MPAYATALVTGASSGIGDAFARDLAGRGSDLVLVARRAERLDALAGELRAAHGVEVEVLPADLLDDAGLQAVAGRLRGGGKPVDLLVNNAGDVSMGRIAERDTEDLVAQARLNYVVPVQLSSIAAAAMVARGQGGILNVSSVAGFQPLPNAAVYSSSKAAVTTFSESLHAELSRKGVHVTVVAPGFTTVERDPQTGILWLDRHQVARAALDAVERNQAVCIPGLQYKALVGLVGVLPRGVVRFVASRAPVL